MDINRFLHERHARWQRLEALLSQVESAGWANLSPAEVREFGSLYRRVSSDLVQARSQTGNAEVLEYLNDLVARAYSHVYRSPRLSWRDGVAFLAAGFPRLFRETLTYTLVAAMLFMGGAGFGYFATATDPAAPYQLLGRSLAAIQPKNRGGQGLPLSRSVMPNEAAVLSSAIMTNNIRVSFLAFASGVLFGVGTVGVLFFNGIMLGSLTQTFTAAHQSLEFWSLILPHGIIELTAIFIAGGAGLLLGKALALPGRRRRRDALAEHGQRAIRLILGVIPLLVLAGTIEGFVTPLPIGPYPKLVFAFLTAVGLVAYLGWAGRNGER
ncbi:MAG: stage II sporulation protein M [Abditibacteriales bacterium]|nr:stage II sporulation protein M [Abditibacteriales bacterium]MDW8365673.1 stage II sporulation protein M [Abditibacteriales bacterium]